MSSSADKNYYSVSSGLPTALKFRRAVILVLAVVKDDFSLDILSTRILTAQFMQFLQVILCSYG